MIGTRSLDRLFLCLKNLHLKRSRAELIHARPTSHRISTSRQETRVGHFLDYTNFPRRTKVKKVEGGTTSGEGLRRRRNTSVSGQTWRWRGWCWNSWNSGRPSSEHLPHDPTAIVQGNGVAEHVGSATHERLASYNIYRYRQTAGDIPPGPSPDPVMSEGMSTEACYPCQYGDLLYSFIEIRSHTKDIGCPLKSRLKGIKFDSKTCDIV